MRRKLFIGIMIFVSLLLLLSINLMSNQRLPRKRRQIISAWVSQSGEQSGLASIKKHGDQLSSISPMWYSIDEDGRLKTGYDGGRPIVKAAKSQGILVIPTISNQFEPDRSTLVLNSDAKRRRLIKSIVKLVSDKDYDGVDLDFENMLASDRQSYTRFTAELKEALRPLGALLTVDVHAKTSDPGGWQGPQSHDYSGLAGNVDQVRVMAYDQHYASGPPGPVASIKWVKKVVRFAASQVPPDKLVLGIPLYGYDWGRGRAVSVDHSQAISKARRFNARIRWDTGDAGPWFKYQSDGQEHTVWFENARSVAAKLDVDPESVSGYSFFRLGLEDPKIWTVLENEIQKKGR